MSKQIAVIPGDGIGPEVIDSALQVLEKPASPGEYCLKTFSLGANRYFSDGQILSDDDLEELKTFDAILLGAVGDPRLPSGLLERGLLLKLRFALDHYVNLRPAKTYPGVPSVLSSPHEIDFVVVREGTEGLYCGSGGVVRVGTPQEVATEVSVNTAYGVERTVRYAFELAMKRRKKLTLVHKHNVLVHAGHLYLRTVQQLAQFYPQVEWDYIHVDAATIYLITDPSRFDVVVTDNLFGDILTDQAAAITGGIGLAASGNLNPDRKFPSMFEPVHGSAPDIAGKNLADPRATIISVALMLDFLGDQDKAQAIQQAITQDFASHPNKNRSTSEITKDVLSFL